ncbi:MAG: xylB [Polyangiaceae bacterium]|nr:xylB [Polyangiaceae bacterium]
MAARLTAATRIIAIDRVPERLALAQSLGATDTLEHGPDTVAQLKEMTGERLDFSVEATNGSNLV